MSIFIYRILFEVSVMSAICGPSPVNQFKSSCT